MDYAFLLPHLLMTYLYLCCTRPFSRRSWIFATVMVSNGGMISITLKVMLLHLVRLSYSILHLWSTVSGYCMILRWKSFTNIRTLVSLRITLAHFRLILTIISIRPGKKLVWYFLPIFIVRKSRSFYLCEVLEASLPAHAVVWCWTFYVYFLLHC